MKKIFCNYGIEIFSNENKYYIRYDAGEIVDSLVEIVINEEDVELAQKSEKDAYEVILKYQ